MTPVRADGAGRELADLQARWVHAPLEELVAAAGTWVAHPCAGHRIDASAVWWDTGTRLRDADRFDTAVDAFDRAIAAGYRSWPLPEAEIAECWLRSGRFDDADRLYVELLEREPGDVWLYNAAGFAYAAVGDHATALMWFTTGVEIALDTGDPERLVPQLDEARTHVRTALGLDPDDLSERAAQFVTRPWVRPAGWIPLPYQGPVPVTVPSCASCGWMARPATGDRMVSQGARRNERCWCGSGRKYKRCCALTDGHSSPIAGAQTADNDPTGWSLL